MAWLTRCHVWLKRLQQSIRHGMPPWLAAQTPRAGIADSMSRRHEHVQPHAASAEGMPVGDDVLLQLIAGGNQHAFRTLYDRYSRRVFSLALHISGDRRRAEDVTEEVFVLVWHHHAIGQSWTGVQDWIAAITRTHALAALRSPDGTVVQNVVVHAPTGLVVRSDRGMFEGQADTQDTRRQALATLPADQRQALERVYYGGHTAAEIASDKAVPVSTIETRLRLALMTLRARVGKRRGSINVSMVRDDWTGAYDA